MIKIRVKGKPKFDRLLKEAMDDITHHLHKEIKGLTPVDTGYARASWKKRMGRDTNRIVNPAQYISFLDKGSSSQAPKGMTKPAINIIRERTKQGKYRLK